MEEIWKHDAEGWMLLQNFNMRFECEINKEIVINDWMNLGIAVGALRFIEQEMKR